MLRILPSAPWSLLLAALLATSLPSMATALAVQGSDSLQRRAFWRINAADAQFDFKPFELRNICMDCDRKNVTELYGCTLKFDWLDPNSAAENNVTACSCSYSWAWDGVTLLSGPRNTFNGESYSICQVSRPTFFEMHIEGFHAVDNMTLSLGRRLKNTAQFKPPFVYPITYAEPAIKFRSGGREALWMQYFEPGPVKADILGISL